MHDYTNGSLPKQNRPPRPRSIGSEALDLRRAGRVIGPVPIDLVTNIHANALASGARAISVDGKGHLSAEAVKRAYGAARRVLDHAVRKGLIDTNAFRAVSAPTGSAQRERYLTPEELALIWQTATRLGRPFDKALQFLVAMPVRRSIARNLRWADIDLDNAVLRVRPEIEGNKSKFEWKLPMNSIALDVLGKPGHPKDLVFPGQRGGLIALNSGKVAFE